MQHDDQTLARAYSGDAEAFAAVFEALRPKVFAVACRWVGVDTAEDVVMDTYLKAWRSIRTFRGAARMSSWLYRIAHNCAMDHLRRRERKRTISIDAPDADGRAMVENLADPNSPQPGATMEAAELTADMDRMLERLPEAHRMALLLRYTDGLTYAEIAAATGVAIGTVMSRIFNGKRKLRTLLEGGVG